LLHPCATPFACLGRRPPVHQRNKSDKNEQAQNVKTVNNFHQSTLVRYVAKECGIEDDLGVKGKRGTLKSVATRRKFLVDKTHRIRFVYVPKHTSWLNQIEIWFSILARRVIKRGNFTSVKDLRDKILAFIAYFNATLAKPFKWTYTGRPLNV
jgi:transposase